MNNQQSEGSGFSPIRDLQIVEILLSFFFQALGSVPQMFLRRRFGINHFGMSTGCGILLFWLYYGVTAELSTSEPFGVVFLMWLALNIWHRISAYRHDGTPNRVHSRYNGWPILCDLLPISERIAKRWIEPIFMLLCSMIFIAFNAPCLLLFFACASFASGIDSTQIELRMKSRVRQIRDAEIDQEVLMNEFDRYSK